MLSDGIAGAQSIGYTGAFVGARGAYPTERVASTYVFNSVDITGGPARVALTVPWMRVETTLPQDPLITPILPTTSTGMGDPIVRLDLQLIDNRPQALQVGVAAAVKLAVVDVSTGRGTGEADYAAGATAFKTIRRTSLMADVLYWKYGDPEGFDFADSWSYSVGASQVIGTGRWSAYASVSGFSSAIADMPAPMAINMGVLTLVGRRQSLAVTASLGLNQSSTDFSLGTSWRISR